MAITWSQSDTENIGLTFEYEMTGDISTKTLYPENGTISAQTGIVRIEGNFDVHNSYTAIVKVYEGNNTLSTDVDGINPIEYHPGENNNNSKILKQQHIAIFRFFESLYEALVCIYIYFF